MFLKPNASTHLFEERVVNDPSRPNFHGPRSDTNLAINKSVSFRNSIDLSARKLKQNVIVPSFVTAAETTKSGC